MYMNNMHVFCTSSSSSPPAAGLFSRSRLHGTQGERVYTAAHVWAPAGLRGACFCASEVAS